MKRILGWTAAGMACAGLIGSPVMAAGERPVAFCGTVVALTENGCIGVTAGSTKYELGAADPRPPVGAVIAGSGTPANMVTTCQEGTHLTNITWKAVASCPSGDRRPVGY